MTVTPPSAGAKRTRWVPRMLLVLDRERLALARHVARARLLHAAAPAGERVPETRAPACGQSPSTPRDVVQPSMKPASGVVSYQSASASLARPGTSMLRADAAHWLQTELAADEVEAGGDGVQARPELDGQAAGARPRRPSVRR